MSEVMECRELVGSKAKGSTIDGNVNRYLEILPVFSNRNQVVEEADFWPFVLHSEVDGWVEIIESS